MAMAMAIVSRRRCYVEYDYYKYIMHALHVELLVDGYLAGMPTGPKIRCSKCFEFH